MTDVLPACAQVLGILSWKKQYSRAELAHVSSSRARALAVMCGHLTDLLAHASAATSCKYV